MSIFAKFTQSLIMEKTTSIYESQTLLEQYLLFHYGSDEDLMPFAFGPKDSLHFPVKCIQQCLDVKSLPKHARALDLGCAVGRSSFELSRYCDDVTGIDNSKTFINAAKQIQHLGSVEFFITEEGTKRSERTVMRPVESNPERIHFHCGDVMDIFQDSKQYEVIFAANLICRLPNPLNFLNRLSGKIVPGGQLIIASPYSWLDEFTPSHLWPQDRTKPIEYIKDAIGSSFELKGIVDMPFLIREHYRKYQWGVSQNSVWKRLS